MRRGTILDCCLNPACSQYGVKGAGNIAPHGFLHTNHGKPLVCGRAPEDITLGQLRWLRERRPEAIPPSVTARLNDDGTLRPEGQAAASAEPSTPAE